MFQLDGLEATEVTLFIPSHENGPLVQATGFQDNGFQDNGIDAHVKLAPWSIPVVVLPVLDAFAFLSSLPPTGDESYKLGDSLRYFRESTRLP